MPRSDQFYSSMRCTRNSLWAKVLKSAECAELRLNVIHLNTAMAALQKQNRQGGWGDRQFDKLEQKGDVFRCTQIFVQNFSL